MASADPILVSINSRLFWWAFTALTLGAVGWVTNLHQNLNRHNERIGVVETQIITQGKQLDKIDGKVDRVLDRLTEKNGADKKP